MNKSKVIAWVFQIGIKKYDGAFIKKGKERSKKLILEEVEKIIDKEL